MSQNLNPQQSVNSNLKQQEQASNRPGCLTVWAAFGIIATGLLLVLSLAGVNSGDPIDSIPALSISISVATIIGYIGVLCLKKWGYYLVLSMYILITIARIGIAASAPLLVGDQAGGAIFGGMVGGIIFFALGLSALQYMD
jgi:hypothetical protein